MVSMALTAQASGSDVIPSMVSNCVITEASHLLERTALISLTKEC
jgi:hypothetical protein